MEFIVPEIDVYVEQHTSEELPWLKALNRATHLKVLNPRMLSGHFQGRILSLFSKMIQPKRILEIGTYTGYSALCLAEGLMQDGKLITIDVNEELEEFVAGFIEQSPFSTQIEQVIGDATQVIPTLDEFFDIVFIDADKRNYPHYYELVLPKVRPGGYIISDNVLWSGKVAFQQDKMDKDTQILADFNKMIQDDERVENVLFPIRDGLMVARKK